MTAEKLIGKLTAQAVASYLTSYEHRKQFEQWYLKNYKTQYVWKEATVCQKKQKKDYIFLHFV